MRASPAFVRAGPRADDANAVRVRSEGVPMPQDTTHPNMSHSPHYTYAQALNEAKQMIVQQQYRIKTGRREDPPQQQTIVDQSAAMSEQERKIREQAAELQRIAGEMESLVPAAVRGDHRPRAGGGGHRPPGRAAHGHAGGHRRPGAPRRRAGRADRRPHPRARRAAGATADAGRRRGADRDGRPAVEAPGRRRARSPAAAAAPPAQPEGPRAEDEALRRGSRQPGRPSQFNQGPTNRRRAQAEAA